MKSVVATIVFLSIVTTVSAGWCTDPPTAPVTAGETTGQTVSMMTWNIWHGGREDGKVAGPRKVVDVIRQSGADLVAMQETYGSGEQISRALGYHFLPRGTNVSIHSRHPILEDISVFKEFQCVGALIELPSKHRVAFYSIWLPYGEDIWLPGSRDDMDAADQRQHCKVSANDLNVIETAIRDRLAEPKYDGVSVVIAGDFNSMSHVDYRDVASDQFGPPVDWETSRVLTERGFRDAYRETVPVIDRDQDSTWSPRFPEQIQDRIDFIYYRSKHLVAKASRLIARHPDGFPSDHAAVITQFRLRAADSRASERMPVKVTTYNIKRGLGMDGTTDIERAASVLRRLGSEIVGLQEIDFRARRSGTVNQMQRLSESLQMHAAFSAFMNYDGGRYGLGVLSRFPIQDVKTIQIPKGNEPRVAIAVQVRLPNDKLIWIVNMHFDWVRDDGYRYAQAKELIRNLQTLAGPKVLLGDFNDVPKSRTLSLFREFALEAKKDPENRKTCPADQPSREIDYLFASPADAWKMGPAMVENEPVVSDHRPVTAILELK